MMELKSIRVTVEPYYYSTPRGIEKQLRINVKYNGQEYCVTKPIYPSDIISVFDLCFDEAKWEVKSRIEDEFKKVKENEGR